MRYFLSRNIGVAWLAVSGSLVAANERIVLETAHRGLKTMVDASEQSWIDAGFGGYLFLTYFDINRDGIDDLLVQTTMLADIDPGWEVHYGRADGSYQREDLAEKFPFIPPFPQGQVTDEGVSYYACSQRGSHEIYAREFKFSAQGLSVKRMVVDPNSIYPGFDPPPETLREFEANRVGRVVIDIEAFSLMDELTENKRESESKFLAVSLLNYLKDPAAPT